jgi:hypothetical protein
VAILAMLADWGMVGGANPTTTKSVVILLIFCVSLVEPLRRKTQKHNSAENGKDIFKILIAYTSYVL